MTQPVQIQRFDFFALQDFIAPVMPLEEITDLYVIEPLPLPPTPSFNEAELERAKRIAYDEGIAEGIQRGRTSQLQLSTEADNQMTAQLRIAADRLMQAGGLFQHHIDTQEEQLKILALGIAKKIAVQSLRDDAEPVIAAMIAHCLPHVLSQPALLVRVHPDVLDRVTKTFTQLAENEDYEGAISVRSDDSLHHGDIRIDWQFGSAERRVQTLMNEIETLFLTDASLEKEYEQSKL